jgi:hypothetical protein
MSLIKALVNLDKKIVCIYMALNMQTHHFFFLFLSNAFKMKIQTKKTKKKR